jgi:RHS repeat-associated protein
MRYTYSGIGYANPDAVTQIANGLSTTTFTYDNNGNVTQKTVDGTTTTYIYDYANRLTALGAGGATTTYGYDAFGTRVLQTGTSTTTLYPFKWYSVASSTGTGAKFSTTTEYVFNGDSLVATVDQQTASGNATGSPATHYIHPDHLGSTNAVTNASGNVEQTLDYLPYGATRISSGQKTTGRQYIGQFTDDSSLSYLQARYYDSARGQFLSQDPVFWELGQTNDGRKALLNPQVVNAYGYSADNPITNKDPNGRCPICALGLIGAGAGMAGQYGFDVYNNIQSNGLGWADLYNNLSSPQTYLTRGIQGAAVAVTGGAAASYGIAAQMGIVGAASGATGAVGNAYLGDPVTLRSVTSDTVFGGLTFGLQKFIPGVPGRLPNFGTDAFFFGQHTQQSALQLSYGAFSNYVSAVVGSAGSTQQSRSAAVQSINTSSGASSPQSQLWVTPSGAVVTWGGNVIVGPMSMSTPSTSRKRVRKKRKAGTGEEVTVYKPALSVMGGGLIVLAIVFFGLTLPLIIEGAPLETTKLMGLAGFWLIGIALTLYPLGFELEVGSDYVHGSLYGLTISDVHSSDVRAVVYGNLFFGSLGGKGLTYRTIINGRSKTYTVGEIIYGKEAIEHARRVLSSGLHLTS